MDYLVPMQRFFLLISLLISINMCEVCGQSTINGELDHDGGSRSYILYVPESYDPDIATPLLLSFHGFTSSAQINFNYTRFTEIADTAGFILIHPQGELLNGVAHWNVGGWTLGSRYDDVGFVSTLLDDISSNYNIDQERIYSTGMSNGGYMSFLLACDLSSRIAAVASVTGSMTPQTYNGCSPTHPTPVLQIHGTADRTVPYTGDPAWTRSIDDVLSYWVDYNNCDLDPKITRLPNISISDGSIVDHFIFENGNNGIATEHFKIDNGGHDWPGAFGNMDINASIEVWKFLSRYDIHGLRVNTTTPTQEEIIDGRSVMIYPNPTSDVIIVEAEFLSRVDYSLHGLDGVVMKRGVLDPSRATIDLSGLEPNIYFIKIGSTISKIVKTK